MKQDAEIALVQNTLAVTAIVADIVMTAQGEEADIYAKGTKGQNTMG